MEFTVLGGGIVVFRRLSELRQRWKTSRGGKKRRQGRCNPLTYDFYASDVQSTERTRELYAARYKVLPLPDVDLQLLNCQRR